MNKESISIYKVIKNPQEQYSIWPYTRKIPNGWIDIEKEGSKEQCLNFILEISGNYHSESVSIVDKLKEVKNEEKTRQSSISKSEKPLVSIIMPTYNREKLISTAIKTVINQTYSNWELLVIDDRSQDNTKILIEGYSLKDNRIKYLQSDRKKGPSGARNFGILNAKGKYIAFLDSDDEWLEHHLNRSIEVLESEDIKICMATHYEKINGKIIPIKETNSYEELEKVVIILKPRVKGNLYFFGEGFFEYNLMESFNLYHINTMVVLKEVLDKIGIFNEELPVNEDYDLMFRIFHDYEFCYIDEYHFIYNYGNDNLYAYTDRGILNKENQFLKDKTLVKKLTITLNNRIIAYNYRKDMVLKSTKIKNKEYSIKLIDAAISRSYLTLGYIYNRNNSKLKAFKYYKKSLGYYKNKNTYLFIGRAILPILFNRFNIDETQLRF